jgi:hypothetical protein
MAQVREGAMQELSGVLGAATAAIEEGYFRFTVHGSDLPIYRERVYCYELYHQMRCLWRKDCAFVLNGEVDKAAHPTLLELGAAGFKPDLLVHRPGDMEGNHTVMEVKASVSARKDCLKDLETLALFRSAVRYERAIYLVYGHDITDRLIERIIRTDLGMKLRAPTELWLHREVGQPAQLAYRLGEPT